MPPRAKRQEQRRCQVAATACNHRARPPAGARAVPRAQLLAGFGRNLASPLLLLRCARGHSRRNMFSGQNKRYTYRARLYNQAPTFDNRSRAQGFCVLAEVHQQVPRVRPPQANILCPCDSRPALAVPARARGAPAMAPSCRREEQRRCQVLRGGRAFARGSRCAPRIAEAAARAQRTRPSLSSMLAARIQPANRLRWPARQLRGRARVVERARLSLWTPSFSARFGWRSASSSCRQRRSSRRRTWSSCTSAPGRARSYSRRSMSSPTRLRPA